MSGVRLLHVNSVTKNLQVFVQTDAYFPPVCRGGLRLGLSVAPGSSWWPCGSPCILSSVFRRRDGAAQGLLLALLPLKSGLSSSCSWLRVCMLGHIRLFATRPTIACLSPLTLGFPRQEYWSGCHSLRQGSSRPRDRPRISCVSCIAGGFFPC